MSFSDILQFVGTGSVPVIVAGTVYGVFELGEKLASQRAKDALSKWLLSFDVRKAEALPDGTQELFERIFGERHFSLKCFIRSAAFSLGAMAFTALIMLLVGPKEVLRMAASFFSSNPEVAVSDWVKLQLWFPLSILIDYVSLFKTRFIFGFLARMHLRNAAVAGAIVAIDYIVYRLIFILGTLLLAWETAVMRMDVHSWLQLAGRLARDLPGLIIYDIRVFGIIISDMSIYFIFFWSGFAPSIWMWLYVFALFVTLILLRSERTVNWLRWFLDVEKNPFRSIGAVAAALAFIASVAIILVSAVITRISGAA